MSQLDGVPVITSSRAAARRFAQVNSSAFQPLTGSCALFHVRAHHRQRPPASVGEYNRQGRHISLVRPLRSRAAVST